MAAIEAAAHAAPILVKGMSPRRRAAKLDWLREYSGYIEVDYTRFDQTIGEDIISTFEHHVLGVQFARSEHPEYKRALELAMTTRGVSDLGAAYSRRGGRCSGDAHTSIANGLLNAFLTWVCMRNCPKNNWRSIHEGDDGIIAIRNLSPTDVMGARSMLSLLGFDAKLKSTHDLTEVIFCGRRFIDTTKGLMDQADVIRTLRKYNASMKQGDPMVLLAKSLSYNYTDGDTPLIGALSYAVCRVLHGKVRGRSKLRKALVRAKDERWLTSGTSASVWAEHLAHLKPPDPSPEAYAAVCAHEGLSYAEVKALEEEYLSWITLGHIPSSFSQIQLDWAHERPHRTPPIGDVRNDTQTTPWDRR